MSDIRADRDGFHFESINARNVFFNTGDHAGSGSAGGNNGVRQGVFHPSFYVPPNPSEVLLDFGLPLDGSEPATPEAKVLREILRESVNEEKTRIVSIHGKAGVGKSCILRELGDNKLQEKLKDHFPGGIYFLSLGMDATESTLMQGLVEIVAMSGGEELARRLSREENLRVVVKKVKEWMKGKKCLILLDDFWDRNGLGVGKVREVAQIFSENSGSVLVMTTRFIELTTLGPVVKVEEREAMSEEAETILLNYAKFEREEIEDKEEAAAFYKVLKMCAGVPLFLCVVGRGVAQLSQELNYEGSEKIAVWVRYWEKLQAVGQDELLDTESDEYPDLSKTLRLSLELLSERRGRRLRSLSLSKLSFEEMHRALCVFKKQARIPISVCRRLWNVKSDEAAFWIGKWFAGVGLADIERRRVGEKDVEFMRLHDLVHMFAVESAEGEEGIARWHGQLLEGYLPKGRGNEMVRKWWDVCKDVREDGYLFDNICRHLVSSGNVKELEGLLASGEWSKFRHEIGGLSAWKNDFWECFEGKKKDGGSENETELVRGLEIVRDAIVESWKYVHENPEELGYQVVGRLIDCENEVVRRYLRSIEKMQYSPWLKPMQRCWGRPGEGMMIGELDLAAGLGGDVLDIALHKKSFTAVVGVGKKIAIIDLKEMRVTATCDSKVKISVSNLLPSIGAVSPLIPTHAHGHNSVRALVRISESSPLLMDFSLPIPNHTRGHNSDHATVEISGSSPLPLLGAIPPLIRNHACGDNDDSTEVETSGALPVRIGNSARGYNGDILKVGISSDGKRAFSWAGGETIRQWDIKSGEEHKDEYIQLDGEESEEDDRTMCVAFSAENSFAVTGSERGKMKVWDLRSGERVGGTMDVLKGVECITMSPNGQIVAAGLRTRSVVLCDVQNCRPLCGELEGHVGSVRGIAFSADGRFVASCANDRTIRLWDVERKTELGDPFVRSTSIPYRVVFSEDSKELFSANPDGSISVWDVRNGTIIRSWGAHAVWVSCVAVTGNDSSRWAVTGDVNGMVRVWDLQATPSGKDERVCHENSVTCVAASSDGSVFVSGSRDETLRIWDGSDGRSLGDALRGHEAGVTSVAVSSDNRRVVSGSFDHTVRVWDVGTRAQLGDALQGHKERINCVAYSSDNEFVISGSDDQTARVWKVIDYWESGRGVCEPARKRVREAEPGADERLSNRQPLRLEITFRHELPDEIQDWGCEVSCAVVSREGQRVLSGSQNGEVWVWDMKSGKCIDRKQSQNYSSIVRIETSEKDEVVTMDWLNERSRWRLDKEGGLTLIQQGGEGPGITQAGSPEDSLLLEIEDLMRHDRIVQLGCSSQKIADGTGVAQTESQEGSMISELKDVVCHDRVVKLGCNGQKIATLPDDVYFRAWTYNAQRRVLCVGLRDGRVLFFRVEVSPDIP